MKNLKKIAFWLVQLTLLIILYQYWGDVLKIPWLSDTFRQDPLPLQLIATLCCFAIFRMTDIAVNVIFWDLIVSKKMNRPVPGVLKIISGILLAVIFICVVITSIYEKSLTIFLTFSGGLGLVLGIALQNTITDFFSGIVIHFEKPFEIGDFILLNNRRFSSEPLVGQVVSIDWRTTRLARTDGTLIVVPNNQFTTLVVTNLNQPVDRSRVELDYVIGFEVEPERAMDLILAAANSVDRILKHPKAKVKVPMTLPYGVMYKVRFWVIPDKNSPASARDAVNRAVLKHLRYAGITLASHRTDLMYAPMPDRIANEEENKRTLIANVPIFKWLNDENARFLESRLTPVRVAKGQAIVQQGAPDDSMFILTEGLADVLLIHQETHVETQVGQIGPGQFFGEMSLVLGEPRNATVRASSDCKLYQITKDVMSDLFERDEDLLRYVADVIDTRKQQNQNIVEKETKTDKEGRTSLIRKRIKAFFSIG